MKKLITYTAIVLLTITLFILSGCDKEDTECNCNAKFVAMSGGFYYVDGLPIDCETGYPNASNANVGGGYFYECKK